MPDRSAFAKPCDRRSEFRLAVLEAWVSANAVRQWRWRRCPDCTWNWRLHPAHQFAAPTRPAGAI